MWKLHISSAKTGNPHKKELPNHQLFYLLCASCIDNHEIEPAVDAVQPKVKVVYSLFEITSVKNPDLTTGDIEK